MRVLQVIDTLNVGGAERMCVNISKVLSKNNIENAIACTREKGSLGINFTGKLWCFKKKSSGDLVEFIKFVSLVFKFNPTVIHAHSTSLFWSVLLRIFKPTLKIIWHDHYGDSEFLDQRSTRFLFFTIRFVYKIIVVNEKLLQWYNVKIPYRSADITYIRNFPLLDKLPVQKRNTEVFHILQVANFRQQKNYELAIEVIKKLKEHGLKFKWRMVGALVDLAYFNKIQLLITDSNLTNEVEVINDCTAIERQLAWADLGVLTSWSEGLPVSLLEYGLAEKPVVVTNVGQCAEVLNNGEFGRMSSLDPEIFFNIILDTFNDFKKFSTKGLLFRNHIETVFGEYGFIKSYISLF